MPIQSTTQKVTDLSPDGSTKFFLLVDILEQAYKKDEAATVRILDVGGGSRFLQQQLKTSGLQYELTVLDIIPKPDDIEVPYIHADITDNDIPNDSFDVVLSTDVLEHVPESGKRKFVEECLRISKDLCIIAGPFMTDGVDRAEVIVNDFNKQLFGSGQDWLEEHLFYGKPRLEMFYDILEAQKIPHHEFGSQSLMTWLLNTQTNLLEAKLGLDTNAHRKLNRQYNRDYLMMNEFQSPTYRQFVVMYKDAAKQPLVDVTRYTDKGADGDRISVYVGGLMRLYADRIDRAQDNERRLTEANAKASDDIARLTELCKAQERTIEDQSRTLAKLRPLLNVIHSKPVEGVRRLAGAKKFRSNNDEQ